MTATARTGGFAGPDEPLDDGGRRKAATFHLDGPAHAVVTTGPARATIETCAAIGLTAAIDPALADMRWGDWTGRSLADVMATSPALLTDWIADPQSGTPGGETMVESIARMAGWIERLTAHDHSVLAVTHPMTIRAAIAAAIGMAPAAALNIDIAPLGRVTLSFNRGWRLQALRND